MVLKQSFSQQKVYFNKEFFLNREGDMRQAINNLQATSVGFGEVRRDAVFKVCDVPDIDKIKKALEDCSSGDFNSVFFIINNSLNFLRLKRLFTRFGKKAIQLMIL